MDATLAALLDVDRLRPRWEEQDGPLGRIRVRWLDVGPEAVVAIYEAATAAGTAEVVVTSRPGEPDGPFVRWPHDPAMPALAELAAGPGVRRLAWVPFRRATLRDGDRVVKAFGGDADFRAALAATLAVQGAVPTARVLHHDAATRVMVQEALAGDPLDRLAAADAARHAAGILTALRASSPAGAPRFGCDDILAWCARTTEVIGRADPGLGRRARALGARLAALRPTSEESVTTHGDFTVGQLLVRDGRAWVVDFDTLCVAPPAYDVASYAANLIAGRDGDLPAAREALRALCEALGGEPPDLAWWAAACALRRVDRPLRRFKRSWGERAARVLGDAEALL